jgi:hypothetical protein
MNHKEKVKSLIQCLKEEFKSHIAPDESIVVYLSTMLEIHSDADITKMVDIHLKSLTLPKENRF